MRIGYKVWLVGGIPIAIAAAIAVAAWALLNEAERARDGASLAGTIYRNLVLAIRARDDYLQAQPGDRAEHATRFTESAEQARHDLTELERIARGSQYRHNASASYDALTRYAERMRQFKVVTVLNDHLAVEMRERVASLTKLTAQARERQRASNADVITSLNDKNEKLRAIREFVDRAHELRAQIAAVALQELQRNYGTNWDAISNADTALTRGIAQLRNVADELAQMLRAEKRTADAQELLSLVTTYVILVAGQPDPTTPEPTEGPRRVRAGQELSNWADRLLKVSSTGQRALQDEVAQLVTYSTQANETEQAAQNVAIETLKLGQRTTEAFARRDAEQAAAIVVDSKKLSDAVESLPISPLVQTEIIDALDQWRTRLTAATKGLREQNAMIADMDATAASMIEGARTLNDVFAAEAARIGGVVRQILVLGATIGLLLGGITAFFVARSITRPVKSLQQDMLALARNPLAGPIRHAERRDELGAMAQAANYFVTEIGHREAALRQAKEAADDALAELRRTQADLIQSEKLASLGQLVAGVAHEINTPVGIALTTATTLGEEVKSFGDAAIGGQLARSRLEHFIARMKEGSHLLFANLTRAADLVHSFKQVAADQVSSDRRVFDARTWINELLTSLRPVLRKAGHEVTIDAPEGLTLDTYPGALGQVVTNLLMNAVSHAYAPGVSGRMTIAISEPEPGQTRIVFSDDGCGIAAEDLNRVFDPFFTTARSRGNTGLGLHIAFNLVTATLQGRMEAACTGGAGTRFTITIPTRVGESAPSAEVVVAA
jgi:signal transduction histidine kinase